MRKCKLREVDGQQRALGIPAELFAGKLIAAVGAVNFVIQNVHFMMRKTKGQYLPISVNKTEFCESNALARCQSLLTEVNMGLVCSTHH